MFYYVYVLQNQFNRKLYIGYTGDIDRRMKEHNDGKGGKTTRSQGKWDLVYFEAYVDKKDALGRERFLKGGSGRKYLYKQLAHYLNKD